MSRDDLSPGPETATETTLGPLVGLDRRSPSYNAGAAAPHEAREAGVRQEILAHLTRAGVRTDRAVARLVKEYARGTVQRGDRVTTRLKA